MNSTSDILCTLLISLLCYLCCAGEVQDDRSECPPWFFYNTTTKTCECFSSPSTDLIIKCREKEALLKLGYCMTYEEGSGFYVNPCDNVVSSLKRTKGNYIRLPNNVSDLNDYMCVPMNRQGPMCSQCADGFGLAVFSIGHPCTNCTGVWYGVPLYLFIEFVPLTIFYFIVIFFHINVTSAPMVAFVFFSQMTVSAFPNFSNKLIFNTSVTYHFLVILVSFYGIWNLDFFRFVTPPFCVSPHIKHIHIIFLNFISAIYPLCLIVMSCMCIHLYSRNFKPMVWLWNNLIQRFHKCFSVSWDATNKIIDTFATFFLLSYAKFVFASLRALNNYGITFNLQLNMNLSLHQTLYVKPDPSMKYFGKEHLPFAITSMLIFLLIVLPIPLLLTLYPIGSFRSILFKCPIGSRTKTAINIFVQKFYSCYRDSTEGGRDMRSLISIFFILRVLNSLVTIDQIPTNISYSIPVFIFMACSILLALARPYKWLYMNIADALILANLATISPILSQLSGELSNSFTMFFLHKWQYIRFSSIAWSHWNNHLQDIQKKKAKLSCCKKLLRLHLWSGHNDTESDYNNQVISVNSEHSDLQECARSVEEYIGEHSSVYRQVSY